MRAYPAQRASSIPQRWFLLVLCALLPGLARGELAQVDQVSNPVGFLSQTTAEEVGTKVNTLVPALFKDGYAFGYWTAGSERLSDAQGRSLTTGSVTVQGTLTLTAHYFPEDEDTDGDGISDWFEYRNFGDLSPTLEGDPDGDGFTNQRENQLGQEARIPDDVEDGGISFASSMIATFADPSLVKYEIRSDPVGFIDSRNEFAGQNSLQRTQDLHGAKDGYHFAYWSINGVRQASPSGLARNQATFTLNETKTVVAHYLPSDQDEDGDGIMDWFELNQFGNLGQGANDDPDGDGFSNTRENQLGQEAMIRDQVEDGGISFAASTVIAYASDEMVSYVVKSNPVGFVEKIDTSALSGNTISTPSLHGEKDGYHFAYWSLNGVRQATTTGLAVNQVSLQIEKVVELVAHYIPSEQDEDGDGISDWFDLNQFGDLSQGADNDPDGDSFTNERENQLGQEAMIPDSVEDGGISFAASTGAFYFVQSYDRLDGLELNNTETFSFKPAGQEIGHFIPFDSKAPESGGRYRYRLVNGDGSADNAKFKIDGKFLQTNAFLISGTYTIRVRVSNHLNIHFERSFLITAKEDPNAPNLPPHITSDGGEAEAKLKVSENQKFITTVQATDPDGDPVYYSLGEEEDGGLFSIDIHTGKLEFINTPDYENPADENGDNLYRVNVIGSDGRLSDSQSLVVEVTDVDEDSGVVEFILTPSSIEEMKPTGSEVGRFSTTFETSKDPSMGITYSLVSGNGDSGNAKFEIDGNQLLTKESFDFEEASAHSIRAKVHAADGATQVRNFTIQILDVLENSPPEITSYEGAESVNIQILENASVAAKISAKDKDGQSLVFIISEEMDSAYFSISSATGLLHFSSKPDFENPSDYNGDNIYEVAVLVSDGLASDTQILKITVLDDPDEDSDNDGISDREEEEIGTNPNKRDTDDDGFTDGEERDQGTNPLDGNDFPGVDLGFDFSSLILVRENNDYLDKTSQIEFTAVAGETYYFAVDGANADRGVAKINFEYQRRVGTLGASSASAAKQVVDLGMLLQTSDSTGSGFTWVSPKDGIVTLSSNQKSIAGTSVKVFKQLDESKSQMVGASTTENFTQIQFAALSGDTFQLEAVGLSQEDISGKTVTIEIVGDEKRPTNDFFENRILVSGSNGSVSGTITGAASELGEPLHALLPPPQKSVWWKWQSPANGTLVLDTVANGFSPTTKVYAGFSIDDLVPIEIKKSENNGQRTTLEVKEGVEYAFVISGYGGSSGTVGLTFTLSSSAQSKRPQNDDFMNAREIIGIGESLLGSNILSTGQAGEPIHGDTSPPTNSVWWKWRPLNNGQATITTEGSDFDTTLGLYSGNSLAELKVLALNDDDENSRTSRVEFFALGGSTYYLAVDGFEHATGQIVLNLEQTEQVSLIPENDDITNAFTIPSINHAVTGTNRMATQNLEDKNHPASALPHHSVWWKWTADFSGHATFSTMGSDFDTTLALYEGDTTDTLVLIAENDDFFGSSSLVFFHATAGKNYHIMVDGKGASVGNIRLEGKDLRNSAANLSEEEIRSVYLSTLHDKKNESFLEPVESSKGNVEYKLGTIREVSPHLVSSWLIQPWNWVDGGETTDGVSLSANHRMASIQSLFRHSGQKAFKLSSNTVDGAWLSFDRWFYFNQKSSLSWREYFDRSIESSLTSVEYSTDGEKTWTPLSRGTPVKSSLFEKKTISLANLNGKVARLRFRINPLDTNQNGQGSLDWYIDEIIFQNTYHLSEPISKTVANDSFFFANRNSANSVITIEKLSSNLPFEMYIPSLGSLSEGNLVASFLGGSSDFDDHWRNSPWYGYYYYRQESSWFFTLSRGWQFFGGFTIGGAWLYDNEIGWLWTNSDIYPWLYQYGSLQWVYDFSPTTGTRFFQYQQEK